MSDTIEWSDCVSGFQVADLGTYTATLRQYIGDEWTAMGYLKWPTDGESIYHGKYKKAKAAAETWLRERAR